MPMGESSTSFEHSIRFIVMASLLSVPAGPHWAGASVSFLYASPCPCGQGNDV